MALLPMKPFSLKKSEHFDIYAYSPFDNKWSPKII